MSVKTSYSQSNTYISCPKHWQLNYKEGWESPIQGASTFFGSAIDAGVTAMLEQNPDFVKVFYDRWNKAFNFGKSTVIFDNPDIVYSGKDFDADVIEAKDEPQMVAWATSLNLAPGTNKEQCIALFRDIANKKKNPYKNVSKDEMTFYNRMCWLSMKRKGKILLNSFHQQFLPKVKRVISTQGRAQIQDPNTGDTITGFIDMVLEIDGYDKPIIFDLKTAANPYSQQDIDLTQQLTLYAAMKGQEYNTDLVGYVVLSKNIQKSTVNTCKSCGHTKNSSHHTCNNIVGGKRCGGEWDEKVVLEPQVQVLVEKKDPNQINDLLMDYGNIILAMKQEIVYKNTSKCNNWYGSQCPFYGVCHKNDYTGLTNKKGNGGTNGV